MSDIKQQLHEAAKRSGWSMLRMSRESGLNYQTIHGFVTGTRSITVDSAAKLAAALGLALTPIKTKGGR